jgi:hypothetical protein
MVMNFYWLITPIKPKNTWNFSLKPKYFFFDFFTESERKNIKVSVMCTNPDTTQKKAAHPKQGGRPKYARHPTFH